MRVPSLRQLSKFAPSGILLLSDTAGLIQLSYRQDPAVLAEGILDNKDRERKAMNKRLSEYFSLNRRYSRSINVEHLELPNTVPGYVLTEKSVDALRRILAAFTSPPVEPPGRGSDVANHLTRVDGVYGTGKSALPIIWHLCANQTSQMRHRTGHCQECTRLDSLEYKTLENIPQQGLFERSPQHSENR